MECGKAGNPFHTLESRHLLSHQPIVFAIWLTASWSLCLNACSTMHDALLLYSKKLLTVLVCKSRAHFYGTHKRSWWMRCRRAATWDGATWQQWPFTDPHVWLSSQTWGVVNVRSYTDPYPALHFHCGDTLTLTEWPPSNPNHRELKLSFICDIIM